MGTSALLISKMRGAKVIAAAGSDEKCQRLTDLGAGRDHQLLRVDIARYCREQTGGLFGGGGYDVVVNFTGGDTWPARCAVCAKVGRVLTCGATAGYDPPTDLRFIWTAEMDIRGSQRLAAQRSRRAVADGADTRAGAGHRFAGAAA